MDRISWSFGQFICNIDSVISVAHQLDWVCNPTSGCLPGGHGAKALNSGGQRVPRSRQARPFAASVRSSAAQKQDSAQCSAWSPGLRRARRVAGTQGVKRGRPGRAAGRRRARELGLQTAPAGPGVRAPAQPQPPARAQPHSAPVLALPRSELRTPRCAPLGAETSAHPQVSSSHGSPANPALRRGDRRLRGDDKLSSGRGRAWGHPWGREAAGAAGEGSLD
ncbi:hypothetical protein LEMLEM_LOCUS20340 [Lemmus lemmus]